MNKQTFIQLNRLNQLFYNTLANSFSQTRSLPNTGWDKLIPYLHTIPNPHILDLGCGNGRFLKWLQSYTDNVRYTGVDQSENLLNLTPQASTPSAQFIQADILTTLQTLNLSQQPSVITAFGLTHHIPGTLHRLSWFTQLARLLQPGGLLIYTNWQIYQDPRFSKARQTLNLPKYQLSISKSDLEAGDYILPWQDRTDIFRYVHIYSPSENAKIRSSLQKAGLSLLESYVSDGKTNNLNQYFIWEKA